MCCGKLNLPQLTVSQKSQAAFKVAAPAGVRGAGGKGAAAAIPEGEPWEEALTQGLLEVSRKAAPSA